MGLGGRPRRGSAPLITSDTELSISLNTVTLTLVTWLRSVRQTSPRSSSPLPPVYTALFARKPPRAAHTSTGCASHLASQTSLSLREKQSLAHGHTTHRGTGMGWGRGNELVPAPEQAGLTEVSGRTCVQVGRAGLGTGDRPAKPLSSGRPSRWGGPQVQVRWQGGDKKGSCAPEPGPCHPVPGGPR